MAVVFAHRELVDQLAGDDRLAAVARGVAAAGQVPAVDGGVGGAPAAPVAHGDVDRAAAGVDGVGRADHAGGAPLPDALGQIEVEQQGGFGADAGVGALGGAHGVARREPAPAPACVDVIDEREDRQPGGERGALDALAPAAIVVPPTALIGHQERAVDAVVGQHDAHGVADEAGGDEAAVGVERAQDARAGRIAHVDFEQLRAALAGARAAVGDAAEGQQAVAGEQHLARAVGVAGVGAAEAQAADYAGGVAGDGDHDQPVAAHHEDFGAVGLDDVGFVDAGDLHVGARLGALAEISRRAPGGLAACHLVAPTAAGLRENGGPVI